MDYLKHKRTSANRRSHRVRTVVIGSALRPRLSVHVSNTHISAQLIDDSKGSTVVYATTVGHKIDQPQTMTVRAAEIGKEIALKAKKAKIKSVVFDRGSRKYHGRVKVLAEAARQNGLEF